MLPLQNGLHGAVDGDFLIIAGRFAGDVVIRSQQQLSGGSGDALPVAKAFPQVVGSGERLTVIVPPGEKIMLDGAVAVGGVRKLEAQDLGIIFCLLEAVTGLLVGGLGLDDGNGKIAAVTKKVIGAFLRAAAVLAAGKHNPTVGKSSLLADPFVIPTRGVKFGQDVFPTRVSFGKTGHRRQGFNSIRQPLRESDTFPLLAVADIISGKE